MADRNRLVVMRLADMHRVHPKQITRKCDGCAALCGIYPSGQAAIRCDPTIEIMCHVCQGEFQDGILAPGALFEPAESVDRRKA
jgi:hypothetical protein